MERESSIDKASEKIEQAARLLRSASINLLSPDDISRKDMKLVAKLLKYANKVSCLVDDKDKCI